MSLNKRGFEIGAVAAIVIALVVLAILAAGAAILSGKGQGLLELIGRLFTGFGS